jgi:hypothetical protein
MAHKHHQQSKDTEESDTSKYWKDMFIHHGSPEITGTETGDAALDGTESVMISKKKPIDFPTEYPFDWEIYHPLTINDVEKFGAELSEFIQENNNMFTGITEIMSVQRLKSFIEMKRDCVLFIARYSKNQKIMGCMMTPLFDQVIYGNNEVSPNVRTALTTFLCVHKQIRNKGVCMYIIRKALLYAHTINVRCSYYLLPQAFSQSAISLKQWMRPVHIKNAEQHGFSFVSYNKPGDRTNKRNENMYKVKSVPKHFEWKVIETKKEMELTHQSLTDIIEEKSKNGNNTYWVPRLREWKQWCKTFPTIRIIDTSNRNSGATSGATIKDKGGADIGFATVECKEIFIPKTASNGLVGFIPYFIARDSHGSPDSAEGANHIVMKAALQYAHQQKRDVVLCFETGDLTRECLEENRANPTPGETIIDFYNVVLPEEQRAPKHLFLPLL